MSTIGPEKSTDSRSPSAIIHVARQMMAYCRVRNKWLTRRLYIL
jgi:hypothetical protein